MKIYDKICIWQIIMLQYSVVIPAYNEEGNINELIKRIYGVLLNRGDFEVIVVNDASTDNTLNILNVLKRQYANLYIVNLKRRFGQSGAIYAGLKFANAPVIITMDADLQNPPEEIPKLLMKLNEGYDFVIGIRKKREDNFLKRIASKIANWYRRKCLDDKFHDIGCSLRVFKREVLNCIFPFRALHRFLPYIVYLNNFKVAQVEIQHAPRFSGTTKYGLWGRLFEGLTDITGMRWLKKRKIIYKELFNESNIEFI